jgi:ribonuclease I
VRPLRPGKKKYLAIGAACAALLAASVWQWQRPARQVTETRAAPPAAKAATEPAPDAEGSAERTQPQDFDFYLLALTAHPAYCADGHAREPECRTGASLPLSIHGLWPERLAPGKYPRNCPGPELTLDRGLALELEPLMPGMADRLHEHEWRTHGRCSGLDDDEYFRATLELARRVDAVLRARLATLAGQITDAHALREYADSYQPGLGATLTFHCRRLRGAGDDRPYLVEVRQCVDDDGPKGAPATLLECASFNRRDQGCGSGFRIHP